METGSEPQTIDEVIAELRRIVEWTKEHSSCAGYFAALYLQVTIRIKQGIDDGLFDDAERMERFDVLFASRYLKAFEQYHSDEDPGESWAYAFNTTRKWRPIVLQHLLLGINAHINLDLGIAAAETSPGQALENLKEDFDSVNQTLADLVDGVQQDLAAIWPVMRLFNRYLGSVQEQLINFNIEVARDKAWELAEELNSTPENQWQDVIRNKDHEVFVFASLIRFPGVVGSSVGLAIRLGERGTISEKIAILE